MHLYPIFSIFSLRFFTLHNCMHYTHKHRGSGGTVVTEA